MSTDFCKALPVLNFVKIRSADLELYADKMTDIQGEDIKRIFATTYCERLKIRIGHYM
jgi:hypothetical protein